MKGDIYIDRFGEEWTIQRKVVKRNGKILFLYRLKKLNSVFVSKWFTNEGLWAFILKAKWARKHENGVPVYDFDHGNYDDGGKK